MTQQTSLLEEMRAELARTVAEREHAKQIASEAMDQADEQTGDLARGAWTSQATRYRAKASIAAQRVYELTREIAALEAPTRPVVVTAQQGEDHADTMNYHA